MTLNKCVKFQSSSIHVHSVWEKAFRAHAYP